MKLKEIIKLREECSDWVRNNPNRGIYGPFISRSCWCCNSSHEHLKKVDYPIHCFHCNKIYFKGVDITFSIKEERKEKLERLKNGED